VRQARSWNEHKRLTVSVIAVTQFALRQQLGIAKGRRADPIARSVLTGTQPFIPRVAGSVLIKEGSVSYIVLAVLSVALIRLAIACVYPSRADWGE
jgi:hypothetical protein